ncbi:ABC transporter ATP-binding protein [Pararhodospirillum photometricum]|uniref:ABC transporter component n=1 Tax=Pararhodospirillum photometricum DSM 122 TaxID=1150469 RepID=H6SK03_PARPM|nr:ABC transporter ATP-binding protein [Pararhodospirillum photometricum]CCG08318.1 ABC transporter component [Pararhodospirillum photometricum DSM 122]
MDLASSPPRLQLQGIVKRYAGLVANDHVSLALAPGEIHALLGENGAGKSTLVKIIYGVVRADAGTVLWEGQPVRIASPAQARALGIGMVFQHFSLFESMTVTENVQLALDGERDPVGLARRVAEVGERYGLALDPQARICDLSVGERQRVEIVRCLLQEPRLLIMDEPTSVLTPLEADALFVTLRRLAEEGVTILYISHKLDEIRALCHRATVLRAGRVVDTCDPRDKSARELARMMIGEDVGLPERRDPTALPAARAGHPACLEIDHLSLAADSPFGVPLEDVNLRVYPGEIVGIAGVAGNGQATLLAALSGERPAARPEALQVAGTPVGHLGPAARRDLGLAVVPEERLGRGAVPELSLAENALLSSYRAGALVRRGVIDRRRTHGLARTIIEHFGVRAGGSRASAGSLSGGNLQKFIIGRELMQKPRLLVASQPTWGVDAGAAAAIHRALLDLRDTGAGLLIISQDLDELFAIADRIAVLCAGRLSPTRPCHEVSLEQVGLMMGGLFDPPPPLAPAQEALS